jgi:polar amino acid transport system substrate-binding protein
LSGERSHYALAADLGDGKETFFVKVCHKVLNQGWFVQPKGGVSQMAAKGAGLSKGLIAIVLIIGIVVGFSVGFLTPGLLPRPPATSWVTVIQQRGYIIIGTSSDWPPFEIMNTTSHQLEGFDIELCGLIADYLNVTIQWSDMVFDNLIGACKGGQIDMIAAAMFIEPQRAEQLAFSVPYIRVNEVVIVKNASLLTITELADLEGHPVGVQTGTAEDYELTDAINATWIHRYDRADALMADLIAGGLDAAYVDEPVFTIYAKSYALKVIFTVPAPPTALWCRWENPELLTAINTVILGAYSGGTLDALVLKWFG